jgi:hypothetical protein
MKKIVIIFALLALSGCTNKYSEANFPVRPPELSDCKFFKMSNSSGEKITVVRCPNSTTSTTERVGKQDQTTVVTDGGVEPLKQQ